MKRTRTTIKTSKTSMISPPTTPPTTVPALLEPARGEREWGSSYLHCENTRLVSLHTRSERQHTLHHHSLGQKQLQCMGIIGLCNIVYFMSQQLGSEVERQGKTNKSTAPRTALSFKRKEEELPLVGFEPTALCSLGERSCTSTIYSSNKKLHCM